MSEVAPHPSTIEACAQAAHEANRAYCIAIGDNSQRPWDSAPEWQKESARKGVIGALNGATPEQSHESWIAEKVATGWTYGEEKNSHDKTHPCMVPYAELPAEQRAKDRVYLAVVRALAEALGWRVTYDHLPWGRSTSPETLRVENEALRAQMDWGDSMHTILRRSGEAHRRADEALAEATKAKAELAAHIYMQNTMIKGAQHAALAQMQALEAEVKVLRKALAAQVTNTSCDVPGTDL